MVVRKGRLFFVIVLLACSFVSLLANDNPLKLVVRTDKTFYSPFEPIYICQFELINTSPKPITFWTNRIVNTSYGEKGRALSFPVHYNSYLPQECLGKISQYSVAAPDPWKNTLDGNGALFIGNAVVFYPFFRKGYECLYFKEEGTYNLKESIEIYILSSEEEKEIESQRKHFKDFKPIEVSEILEIKIVCKDDTEQKAWSEVKNNRALMSFLAPYDNTAMICYGAEGIKKRANDAKEFLKKYGDTIYGDRIRMGLGAVLLERKEVFDPVEGEKLLNEVKCKSPEWKDVTRNAYKKAVENCKDSSQKEHFQKLAQQTRSEKGNLEKAGKVEEYTKCE